MNSVLKKIRPPKPKPRDLVRDASQGNKDAMHAIRAKLMAMTNSMFQAQAKASHDRTVQQSETEVRDDAALDHLVHLYGPQPGATAGAGAGGGGASAAAASMWEAPSFDRPDVADTSQPWLLQSKSEAAAKATED